MSVKLPRLTNAQHRELASAPSSCIIGYAPVEKLRCLGLVAVEVVTNTRYHYETTPAGKAWLAAHPHNPREGR